jgi:hypothetical protein
MRKIVRAKRAFRRRQAALPIAEKLRLLDELRERALAIAAARPRAAARSQPAKPPGK